MYVVKRTLKYWVLGPFGPSSSSVPATSPQCVQLQNHSGMRVQQPFMEWFLGRTSVMALPRNCCGRQISSAVQTVDVSDSGPKHHPCRGSLRPEPASSGHLGASISGFSKAGPMYCIGLL